MVRVGEPGPEPDDPVVASSLRHNDPAVRTAGPPAGGGYATAATLARFYQALLHDPATSAGPLWDPAVLADATGNVRCRFTDPMMNVPCNRTIGLVVAGDDGKHMLRQGMFGRDNSPATFGHAGANTQIAWADPATGYSFVYLNSAADPDMMRAATPWQPHQHAGVRACADPTPARELHQLDARAVGVGDEHEVAHRAVGIVDLRAGRVDDAAAARDELRRDLVDVVDVERQVGQAELVARRRRRTDHTALRVVDAARSTRRRAR